MTLKNIYIVFFKRCSNSLLSPSKISFLSGLLLLCSVASSNAQLFTPDTAARDQEVDQVELPIDSLGRRNPYGTVSGFISAAAEEDFDRAALFLNLDSALYENQDGAELARKLYQLLDQYGRIIPSSWLSEEVDGKRDDELQAGVDRVGSITLDSEPFNVFVERIKDPAGNPVWLFSSQTLQDISSIEVDVTTPLVNKVLPTILQERKWGNVSIGQWLIMLILIAMAYLASWATIACFRFLLPLLWKKAGTQPTAGIIKAFSLPIKLYLAVWLFIILCQEAGISVVARQKFAGVTIIVFLIAFLLLLWRLSEFITDFSQKKLTARNHLSGVSVVLFLRRAAKITIVVFGIIAALGIFGVDVTTGLAALGIGGLALALGAQKTIENFVGSVTLIADQPIRIGDFIKAGDTMGTVEQIGMRSTRIRTLDRTIVTIPNGEFSSLKIENYAHRDRFRFYSIFGLRYETTPDQIRYLLVEFRTILYSHPRVDPEPARVRFVEFGSSSLNIEIFAYVFAKDYTEFLGVKEDLLLRMMDVVEASGSGFAFPSQTLYLARDKGLSEENTKNAEEKVKQWKKDGTMPIPNFDEAHIDQLKNSIKFPPEGSIENNNQKG